MRGKQCAIHFLGVVALGLGLVASTACQTTQRTRVFMDDYSVLRPYVTPAFLPTEGVAAESDIEVAPDPQTGTLAEEKTHATE